MGALDDFQYAMENTRVVVPPERRLETFGTTNVHYVLITEDMDRVDLSRIREGRIEAERPEIISPQTMARLMLEGFGEEAAQFADAISAHGRNFTFLKYGFYIRRREIKMHEVYEPFEAVVARVAEQVKQKRDPFSAVVAGVDDSWEVCLLKFMMDLISSSGPGNVDDFRRRGLL